MVGFILAINNLLYITSNFMDEYTLMLAYKICTRLFQIKGNELLCLHFLIPDINSAQTITYRIHIDQS